MRYLCPLILILVVSCCWVPGCAGKVDNPAVPADSIPDPPVLTSAENADVYDPHMLWRRWMFHFSEDHMSVDIVPLRQARLHLNALKFLEEYCADCLEITNIKNNGDSTIDMTVKIAHPFKGHPEYTAFDVKGIIMFNGSHIVHDVEIIPPVPETCIVSWREMGDPEVLNPDSYTYRWHPEYD